MTVSPVALTCEDFSSFFREIFGYEAFPWQVELARRACSGSWPEYLAVPTGSGKTAALDAAVFALAFQAPRALPERTIGRRIFYVVNRRVIVDEAYDRARRIAAALRSPSFLQPTVARVADALRSIDPGATSPLECALLRGGIYRDQGWVRSLTQPLIVCSTVDQVGSRLLFGGYGVSASMRPIHAALVAHDSVLMLDEAHISRPFAQTLLSVAAYRSHGTALPGKSGDPAGASVITPFAFLQMTATPPAATPESAVLRLSDSDHAHPTLAARLRVEKPARLVVAKVSGIKAIDQLAAALGDEAIKLNSAHHPRSIAVLVNRVLTARLVAKFLSTRFPQERVTLLIGRMRPLDRDDVTHALRNELKTRQLGETGPVGATTSPRIVVATQCLEVGADFDFDALITECASLDALRQRFGRLNRGGRGIHARAVIVVRSDQVFPDSDELETNPKAVDPIYGTALSRTWNWLKSIAADGVVDFGLNSIGARVDSLRQSDKSGLKLQRLLSPTTDAPVLLPAYLDAWSQTNPAPVPQPEVALFLHGPGRSDADVQVCWRSDLPEGDAVLEQWVDTVTLCPPSTVECLAIPLSEFHRWFLGGDGIDTGDVLAPLVAESPDIDTKTKRTALIWRGRDESALLDSSVRLRPGDTIILRAQDSGWEGLGHLPGATLASIDQAERGFRQSRQHEILRLRRGIFPEPARDSAVAELLAWASDEERNWTMAQLREVLARARDESAGNEPRCRALAALADRRYGLAWEPYFDEKGVVLKTRHRVLEGYDGNIPDDAGDDALSVSENLAPQPLLEHLADVVKATRQELSQLPLARWSSAIEAAAEIHDWGKADERIQALLLNGDTALAWAQSTLFAKSARMPETAAAYEAARRRAGLPKGFRHEMLSVALAETDGAAAILPDEAILRDLTLHLVASHHGYARPFAPVVNDDNPPDVELKHVKGRIWIDATGRLARPPHRLDSGIAERFWQLTRHFGWWGLAYLETVLRLADQKASAARNRVPPSENEK